MQGTDSLCQTGAFSVIIHTLDNEEIKMKAKKLIACGCAEPSDGFILAPQSIALVVAVDRPLCYLSSWALKVCQGSPTPPPWPLVWKQPCLWWQRVFFWGRNN